MGEPCRYRAALLRRERPDMIFHASAFISPWWAKDRDTPAARALVGAGFGIMASAQLPKIRTLMQAVRDLDLGCPVVNASYPDLTHAVLAADGLAPTIGVGNAGMIFLCILRALREGALARDGIPRLFAHHSQVTPFARDQIDRRDESPWLFLGDGEVEIAPLIDGPLPEGMPLNALTATHAIQIIGALSGAGMLRTAAPGPFGLQGGWPVEIDSGGVRLDLPPGVEMARAVAFQSRAAIHDGIADIDHDGTIHYTEKTRQLLAAVAPDLAEPLRLQDASRRLTRVLELVAA
ncbi:hypothetical protein QE385_003904 [Sphingomonas sp. SORGH_AS 950]|nr:hypothetical protein [Sphingomonas sp. SORGH_AS_0950]